jgi:hypothetical protein
MVQWFHIYEMNDELLAVALRTFRSSFSHTTIWRVDDHDILLVGAPAPLRPDYAAMLREFSRPDVRRDLGRIGIKDLGAVLRLQSAGEDSARSMAGTGPLNRELRPLLEYEAPKAFFNDDDVSVIETHDDRKDLARRRTLFFGGYLMTTGPAGAKKLGRTNKTMSDHR